MNLRCIRPSCARLALFVGIFLAIGSVTPVLAAGTGQISGNVVDAKTGAPVAGAIVEAVAPTDRYRTTTDIRGAFTIAGVTVETYTISVQKQGFDTYLLQGATVSQDETYRIDARLDQQLKTIARVRTTARSIASAFQPDQTIDRTVLSSAVIDQLLTKSFNTNGVQLLAELPGVAIDKNGTPLIRGGTSFQGALEFEGIDYTEPNRSLSDRFENVGSNYLLNGVGSLEIVPGGGDATRGNTGTGLLSLTAKRGAFPNFGTFDYETLSLGGGHQIGFEYGFASPNGRISNYLDFIAEDQQFHYGPYGIDPASQIADPTSINPNLQAFFTADSRALYTTTVFNKANQSSRDFLDNLVFKFGRDNNQQLQFFLQSQALHQDLNYGGTQLLTAVPQTFFYNDNIQNNTVLSGQQLDGLIGGTQTDLVGPFIARFAPRAVGGKPGGPLGGPETIDSPFSAYKIEYDNNLSATTTLALRGYRTDNAASENLPSQGLSVPQEGGIRRGFALDVTKILGSKHTIKFGGKYEFAEPFGSRSNSIDYSGVFAGNYAEVRTGTNPDGTPIFSTVNFGTQTHDLLADFVQPSPLVYNIPPFGGLPTILGGTQGCVGSGRIPDLRAPQAPLENCGYLYRFFPGGPPPLPAEIEVPTARQQSFGLYAQDTWAPNDRLHVLAGLRLDGYNFLLPSDPTNPPAVDGLRHQRLLEPKLGFSYRIGRRDAVRANFGRSLSIPLPTFLGTDIDRASLAAFNNIPSYDSVTGKPATYCGPAAPVTVGGFTVLAGSKPCKNYADQLYWVLRDARFAQQQSITSPLRGATFTNYDFTYSHEFNGGYAAKITPFYRRGYDVVETTQTLFGIDPLTGTQQLSPEIQSNLGVQRATGLEFEITTPQRARGLSATVTATYINQTGNDPPGDYIPTASVALGELYHSPNLAPLQGTIAATYKTSWGLRINPVLNYKSGYPYGNGVYQALTVNGQSYFIPYTDAVYQGAFSGVLSNGAVDPQYPGPITNPNIIATRGTEARTSGPGSLYSPAFVNLDLTVSIAPAQGSHGFTYGVAIRNLFDRTTSVPSANYARDCTLVYTGLCAASGFSTVNNATHTPPQTANANGSPYLIFTNQQPITVRLFAQANF